jgi:pilus assembly protein CpaF
MTGGSGTVLGIGEVDRATGASTGTDPAGLPLQALAASSALSARSRPRPVARPAAPDWHELVHALRDDVIKDVDARRVQGLPVTPEQRDSLADDRVATWLRREAEACIKGGQRPPPQDFADWLRAEVRAAVSPLGPPVRFLDPARWSDVEINGAVNVICTERSTGRRHEFDSPFATDEASFEWVAQHAANAGRRFDESNPSVRFRLPNGMRVHAIGRVTSRTHIDIRLFQPGLEDVDGLSAAGMFGPDVALLLRATAAVHDPIGVLFSGGTGNGKTTLLRAWLNAHPDATVLDRVVTVEDEQELFLDQRRFRNLVEFEAREPNVDGRGEYSMGWYLAHDLRRQTPERVALGELKPDGGVLPLLLALGQGIARGVATTIHAPTDADVLSRIRTYAAYGRHQVSDVTVMETIAASVDLVVHVARVDGRRVVTSVREYGEYRDGTVTSARLWAYHHAAGRAVRTDVAMTDGLAAKLAAAGAPPQLLERDRNGVRR